MPNIGPVELIIILVIALLILGPGKLPDVGAALGKSIREFRKAASDVQDAAKVETPVTPRPNVLSEQPTPNVLTELPTPSQSATSAPADRASGSPQ